MVTLYEYYKENQFIPTTFDTLLEENLQEASPESGEPLC